MSETLDFNISYQIRQFEHGTHSGEKWRQEEMNTELSRLFPFRDQNSSDESKSKKNKETNKNWEKHVNCIKARAMEKTKIKMKSLNIKVICFSFADIYLGHSNSF